MNIALIGYGKMGRMIECLALEKGHRVAAALDPFAAAEVEATASGAPLYKKPEQLDGAGSIDVAFEFTRPDTAAANILALIGRGIPVVTGTTGWYDRLGEIAEAAEKQGGAVLWASNFSLGVNLFYRICWYAAALMDPFPQYDAAGFEAHHNRKADSPSGTAKTLAEGLLERMQRKKTAVYETLDRPPAPEELHFPSLRLGAVPGTHSLFFDSAADTIEITHTARNRKALAAGALFAAEWLTGGVKRTGVFTFEQALEEVLK